MKLYLVQHGEPVAKEIDPERPLSERGRRDATEVARFAAGSRRVEAIHIHHSGKLRARQTAEILAAQLDLHGPLEACGLAPMDDPAVWASQVGERTEGIVLVGHLPHLAKLAGMLLCGGPGAAPIRFQMGGLVALAREEGRWPLQWMVVPDLLQGYLNP